MYGSVSIYFSDDNIDFITVDELRSINWRISEDFTHIFIYGGSTVPGRYLGAAIGSYAELKKLLQINHNRDRHFFIDGALRFLTQERIHEIEKLRGVFLHPMEVWLSLKFDLPSSSKDAAFPENYYDIIQPSALRGSAMIPRHYRFPNNMIEMETSRGCNRKIHCSFCSDGIKKTIISRKPEYIIEEARILYDYGARYFRIGCQSDLMTYYSENSDFREGFPMPNPRAIEVLYKGIRKSLPELKVLHLDNINPGVIAAWPDESSEVLSIIAAHNTEMDVAAMGLESADHRVIQMNHLKITPEKMMNVLQTVHDIGHLQNPFKLNPGLNFLSGLPAEDENTFEKNYNFLNAILKNGIYLRRINIRRVRVFEKTPLFQMMKSSKWKYTRTMQNRFDFYKKKIRHDIDLPMLRLIFPRGKVIDNVIIEKSESWGFSGRPMGSYPITVQILSSDKFKKRIIDSGEKWFKLKVVVISHKERSISAVAMGDYLPDFSLQRLKKILSKEDADLIWNKPEPEVQKKILSENSLDPLYLSNN